MALEKKTAITKIEIVGEFKHIQVRETTWVEDDGVKIGGDTHQRHVVSPLDDTSGECAEVQAIAAAVHTDEVKAAYQAHLDAQNAETGGESSDSE